MMTTTLRRRLKGQRVSFVASDETVLAWSRVQVAGAAAQLVLAH